MLDHKQSLPSLIFCFTLFVNAAVYAQSDDDFNDGVWLLGAGLIVEANPYTDMKTETQAFPYIAYETKKFHIGIDEVSYKINTDESFELTILGEVRLDNYDPDQSNRFDSIDRDSTIEAGAIIKQAFGAYYVEVKALTDILNEHDGYFTQLGGGVKYRLGKGSMEWFAGAVYSSADLNHYLYGVNPNEATANLSAYSPGGGWSSILEAAYVFSVTKKSIARIGVTFESLNSDVKASPRVDSSTESTAMAMMIWRY